jgi:hypothetical protein
MRPSLRFCLTTLTALALAAPALAETDQEVAARAVALDLAGAFSNDGFKLRDGYWAGTLSPNESQLIAVNLYAGNEYWFSAGATEQAKKLAVEVFDETGSPVTTQMFNSGTKAAAGFPVTNSGQYFIRVRLVEGGPAGVCFLYSYK